jgi:uncharacterized protein (TIGR02466 family)
MTSKAEIFDLFPTPLYMVNFDKPIDKQCEKYLINAPTIPNTGNIRSEDGFILNNPMLYDIKQFIEKNIKEYVRQVYMSDSLDIYITQSWANYTKPKEYHHLHSHPNSVISGVFYVSAKEDEDNIRFHKGTQSAFTFESRGGNKYISSNVTVKVKSGDLIIFPSTFIHEVPMTESNETRISIAFNTFIRGPIGNVDDSTYLYLR